MPRNRIIYNVQGLFVAPYSGEQNASSDYYLPNSLILKRIEKVQNFDYSIQQNRSNLVGFNQKKNIFNGVYSPPEVTFTFSYIPDGFTNENRLNFNTANFQSRNQVPMFSGLCSNDSLINDRDFYLAINKNENDLFSQNAKFLNSSVNPSSVNDVIDFNSRNYGLLHFQHCNLNQYSFNISVGNIPTVTQNYSADNMILYTSGSGINYTVLDVKSGVNQIQNQLVIVPRNLDYNQTGISGQNILLPGNANISFFTKNITGVLFYTDTIQSLNFSLDFRRNSLRALNYKFPLTSVIQFPVNGNVDMSFVVEENLSGSFFNTLNADSDYNIIVNFGNNPNNVHPTRLIFSGCKFNNINYSSSIGSNKTANLAFSFDLDPDFGTKGLFASGNVLYSNTSKVLIY
jgi:hypothetical protein